MRRLRIYPLVFFCIVVAMNLANAQDIEERIKKYADDFVKGYMGPFVDAFGASLNSGWYHTADVDDGLSLFVGTKIMIMPIPTSSKTFQYKSPYDGITQDIPTVFGSDVDEVQISNTGFQGGPPIPNPSPATYPKGLGINAVPMIVPHISVGNIFNTRAMLRYFPSTKVGDFGKFEFFGFGAQHSVSQYLPPLPLDIAGNFSYQSMKLGEFLSSSAFTIGAQASKSISILTGYFGLAIESSSMSFSYETPPISDPDNPTQTITKKFEFDISGKNNFRATVGIGLDLLIFKLHADYSLASQPVATIGLGLGW